MIERLVVRAMANVDDDTDEELTGPSAAAGPAQPFGPDRLRTRFSLSALPVLPMRSQ